MCLPGLASTPDSTPHLQHVRPAYRLRVSDRAHACGTVAGQIARSATLCCHTLCECCNHETRTAPEAKHLTKHGIVSARARGNAASSFCMQMGNSNRRTMPRQLLQREKATTHVISWRPRVGLRGRRCRAKASCVRRSALHVPLGINSSSSSTCWSHNFGIAPRACRILNKLLLLHRTAARVLLAPRLARRAYRYVATVAGTGREAR